MFEREIQAKLEEADAKFLTTLGTNTTIRFDLTGRSAGQAYRKGNVLGLRFNVEAIGMDWDGMFNDTIPHEVAHLVTFQKPRLGRNHDHGWRRVAVALGSTGDTRHALKLTPGRIVTKFRYVLNSGKELMIGPIRHKRIQSGQPYSTLNEKILAIHYVPDTNSTTDDKPAPTMSGLNSNSKAGKARICIQAWLDDGLTKDAMLAQDYYVNYIQSHCGFPSKAPAMSCLKVNIERLLNAG